MAAPSCRRMPLADALRSGRNRHILAVQFNLHPIQPPPGVGHAKERENRESAVHGNRIGRERWINRVVLGLGFCPGSKRPFQRIVSMC